MRKYVLAGIFSVFIFANSEAIYFRNFSGEKVEVPITAETTVGQAKQDLAHKLGVKSSDLTIYSPAAGRTILKDPNRTFAQVASDDGMKFREIVKLTFQSKTTPHIFREKRLKEVNQTIESVKEKIAHLQQKLQQLEKKKADLTSK